jgi:hypothetical protein
VSPVRYDLGFYIPEDGVVHSHRRETSNLTKCNITSKACGLFHSAAIKSHVSFDVPTVYDAQAIRWP